MNFEELILNLMKEKEYIPMKAKEMTFLLQVPKEDQAAFKETLRRLAQEGKIAKNRRARYHLQEIKTLVGTFKNSRSFGFVVPDNRKASPDIFISKKQFHGAKENDKVVVQITKEATDMKSPEGKVIEIIGQANEADVDMLSIIKEYKLPYEFPKPVLEEAQNLIGTVAIGVGTDQGQTESSAPTVCPMADSQRKDFRDQTIVTIDGEDAKDLDDAVSVEKTEEGNYILSVHIADVSHYVTENSNLDREAIIRGTSVYMLDRVIPMLPKELSNGICSLNAGEDRYTLSVIMEINQKGEVVSSEVTKGIINVAKRMSYHGVQKVLDGAGTSDYEPYKEQIHLMAELAHILEDRRKQHGYLDLDIPESDIILDEDGYTIDVKPYETTFANQIIEQFMLTANETIAEKFYWLEAPFIYRVHETPDAEKIGDLNKFLWNFGYRIKGNKEQAHPKAFSSILEDVKGKDEEKLVSNLILRTLKIAKYEAQNKGHFGIAGKYYCHFTSPIRRYPDLFIHRIISKYLETNYQPSDEYIERQRELAVKYAESSSERERTAQKAERDAIDLKKAEYMEDKIGEVYEGIVSGVTNFGLFVELENTVEGLIRFENLGDEYFIYNDERKTLTGEHTNTQYTMGDKITVQVIEANKATRKIAFAKVQEEKTM